MGRRSNYDHFMARAKRDGRLEFFTTGINGYGYGYGKQYAYMVHLYGYENDEFFSYIMTPHRTNVVIKRLKAGTWWSIPESIRDNYTHNGYMTRVGLDRAIASAERAARIERISESHDRFGDIGGEDGHKIRAAWRNR